MHKIWSYEKKGLFCDSCNFIFDQKWNNDLVLADDKTLFYILIIHEKKMSNNNNNNNNNNNCC